MDPLIATAASGMRSRMETLDVLANNIANAGTTGYKADEASYNLYFGPGAWDAYNEGRAPGAEMPVVEKNWTDLSQGTLIPTGNSSDLALTSSGFFTVDTGKGLMYTRNGHFHVATSGRLETGDGYAVLGKNNLPIMLDPQRGFEVSSTGEVTQGGAAVSQLAIADAEKLEVAEKRGSGYLRFSPDTKIQAAQSPGILQGSIEGSNVAPAYTAVKLVSVMRSFEMLQRAVTMGTEMNKKAIEEVARVSS
jgi:flagellar basal-body rod protein FlgF